MGMHDIEVIFESSGVIAVWKPSGLATQAPPGIPSAESWLRQRLHAGDPGGYVGVPHRLDRGVSGVVLFAATPRAARKLSRQFERRQVSKSYLAIVERREAGHATIEQLSQGLRQAVDGGSDGLPDQPVTWRDMVEKIPDQAMARIVTDADPSGREALTLVRLSRHMPPDRLLLELSPMTGRMHQLRLQAAARGLPVLGDRLYGAADAEWTDPPASPPAPGMATDDPRTRPIALHACRITYTDPDSGAEVTVEAPLPDFWPHAAR